VKLEEQEHGGRFVLYLYFCRIRAWSKQAWNGYLQTGSMHGCWWAWVERCLYADRPHIHIPRLRLGGFNSLLSLYHESVCSGLRAVLTFAVLEGGVHPLLDE